jgi:hypothetical protein
VGRVITMFFPTVATLNCLRPSGVRTAGWKSRCPWRLWGRLLASLPGAILGFVVVLTSKRWFSALALGVSTWMLIWFGLMMSAAD